MFRLVFKPADGSRSLELEYSPAWSVLVALQRQAAVIRHDCGGRMLCGSCRIALLGSDKRKGFSPMSLQEKERLMAVGAALDGSVRLACQLRASRDIEVEALVPREEG